MIEISYDNQGDILEIKFSDKSIKDSEYVEKSGLVVDYNENGNIVGLEITSFLKKVSQGSDIRSLAI